MCSTFVVHVIFLLDNIVLDLPNVQLHSYAWGLDDTFVIIVTNPVFCPYYSSSWFWALASKRVITNILTIKTFFLAYHLLGTELCPPKIHKPGREFSSGKESASTLLLAFPASRTMRNQFLLYKPPSLWWLFIAAWIIKILFHHPLMPNSYCTDPEM